MLRLVGLRLSIIQREAANGFAAEEDKVLGADRIRLPPKVIHFVTAFFGLVTPDTEQSRACFV